MAERRRRQGDPPDVDHSEERSWFDGIPKRLVAALFSGGVALGVAGWSAAYTLYQLREADMERRYSDWKGGSIADHEYRITTLERESKYDREDAARIDASNKLTRLQTQMENVNAKVDTLTAEVRRALKEN